MKKWLKWGLILTLVYVILTVPCLILNKYSRELTGGVDHFLFLLYIFAGTYYIILMCLGPVVHNLSPFLPFLVGMIIWFFVGCFLGNVFEKKKTINERLSYLGKFLMIVSLGLFVLILLILLTFFSLSKQGDPLGIAIVFVIICVIFGVPFVLGLIFWIISKFLKKNNKINKKKNNAPTQI